MHTIHCQQGTYEWLNARTGRITGTKANGIALEHYAKKDIDKLRARKITLLEKAEKARTDEKRAEYQDAAAALDNEIESAFIANQRLKTTAEFWQFLAESWADPADGENPMERGHRLENTNAEHVMTTLGIQPLSADMNPGMWVSDDDPRIACSPDVHEASDAPTWAIECKSLGSANHLAAVLPIIVHRFLFSTEDALPASTLQPILSAARAVLLPETLDRDATDFDFVPAKYQSQVLQYFAVNSSLETLYFSFFDDRIHSANLRHVFLTIKRADVADRAADQLARELNALSIADDLSAFSISDEEEL